MSSFQKTKWLSLTVLDPIRPTESSTWWQTSRISQQKMHTFCQSNARLHVSCLVFDDQARTVTAWLGSSDSSPAFSQTLHFCIPSYLVFTKGKVLERQNDENALKNGKNSGAKWWLCCSMKFLVKIKTVSLFLLKNQRNFLESLHKHFPFFASKTVLSWWVFNDCLFFFFFFSFVCLFLLIEVCVFICF